MSTQLVSAIGILDPNNPMKVAKQRLRSELQKIADESSVLRPPWEPMLDSLRIVGIVLILEAIIPGIEIAPDKIIRKGGYNAVDEAVNDISVRLEEFLRAS
jgi:hypothetical protein